MYVKYLYPILFFIVTCQTHNIVQEVFTRTRNALIWGDALAGFKTNYLTYLLLHFVPLNCLLCAIFLRSL